MRYKIIIAGLVVGVLGAGCGAAAESEDPAVTPPAATAPSPASSAPQPSAPVTSASSGDELRAAVQAYSDAFLTGDAKAAYALLSERCRKRMSLPEFTGVVEAAERMYGSALPLASYSAKVSGDLARVTYTYAIKAINQEGEPWTREDGRWRQDDC